MPSKVISSYSTWERDQGPVSRKSRKLFEPEKPFVILWPAYSVRLVFSYGVIRIKNKISAKFRASRRLRFDQRKRFMTPWKVSGLSRIGPLGSVFLQCKMWRKFRELISPKYGVLDCSRVDTWSECPISLFPLTSPWREIRTKRSWLKCPNDSISQKQKQ